MTNQEFIRKLFQALALILFIIQFQQSVRKYFQDPIVVQTSRVPVEALPAPVVYVCQVDQYNYTKGKQIGYPYFTYLMTGFLENSSIISWKGKYQNQTYKDLEKELFDYDYTTLNIGKRSEATKKWTFNHTVQKTFLFPHGLCMKVLNIQPKQTIGILTKREVSIFIVDPAKANDIRTEVSHNAEATIGPSRKNLFNFGVYNLDVILNDQSINEGFTCTDYAKVKSSYGECLREALIQELKSVYGCLPPWVSGAEPEEICGNKLNVDKSLIEETNVYYGIFDLMLNKEAEIFKKCLPPCVTMKLSLEKLMMKTNRVKTADLDVYSKDWATVHTHVYSYDIFSLIVDIGSAMGLWMGLSCISILDHILLNWNLMKTYF